MTSLAKRKAQGPGQPQHGATAEPTATVGWEEAPGAAWATEQGPAAQPGTGSRLGEQLRSRWESGVLVTGGGHSVRSTLPPPGHAPAIWLTKPALERLE